MITSHCLLCYGENKFVLKRMLETSRVSGAVQATAIPLCGLQHVRVNHHDLSKQLSLHSHHGYLSHAYSVYRMVKDRGANCWPWVHVGVSNLKCAAQQHA
jgi:hypothetical protein